MKRYSTFIVLMVCTFATAQNSDDILRYSNENLQGTARFQAMQGAFGALGGDLSALNINPAGLAVFNNSLFTISSTIYDNAVSSTYFGTSTNTSATDFRINQAGGAFVFKSPNSASGWNKIAIAGNYDLVQNFDSQVLIAGNSNQGIDNYFLNFAAGVPFGSILLQEGEYIEDAYLDIGERQGYGAQQAFLGYYGGLIDPVAIEDSNTSYISNANYSAVSQNLLRSTSGYNSKFTMSFASQYQEKFNIGASFNFHSILYDRYDEFTETGYDADSEIQRTTFDNLLRTHGSGFSFNIGAIAKLNDILRLGGSYQSPTWYQLSDDLSQRINSDLADEDINFIDLNIINLFPSYNLRTPSKFNGSAALIFGKNGLLSIDYSYQDMSKAELGPTNDPNFNVVNTEVATSFGSVSTVRVGGEYRIQRFSLRGGYRFEQSPYATLDVGDLNGFSGGVGYDFGGSRLDFALSRTERDGSQKLFDTGLDTPALINVVNTNATLSYTMNF